MPRCRYGDYLVERLAAAAAASPARLERLHGEVVWARDRGGALELRLASGGTIACDRAVLALGWLPPSAPWPGDERVITDPWAPGALGRAAREGTTLIVGTGPTAVDVALTVAGAPGTRVVAVSRRGRLPFAHLPGLRTPAPPPDFGLGPLRMRVAEATVRAHIARVAPEGYDWRDVIDGLRPLVPALWARIPDTDRRRFLASRVRAWEIRRHRLAPEVAGEVAALRAAARLEIRAGGLEGIRTDGRRVELQLRDGAVLRGDRVVLCAGAGGMVAGTTNALVADLVAGGLCGARSARPRPAHGAGRRAARPAGPVEPATVDARAAAARRAVGEHRRARAAGAGRGGGRRGDRRRRARDGAGGLEPAASRPPPRGPAPAPRRARGTRRNPASPAAPRPPLGERHRLVEHDGRGARSSRARGCRGTRPRRRCGSRRARCGPIAPDAGSSSCSRSRVSASSAPNGSSISTIAGSVASTRAIWQRCCMPPDNSYGRGVGESVRPTSSSAASAIARRSPRGHAAHPQPELDVAAHVEPRVEVRLLEDDAAVGRGTGDGHAADGHAARRSGRRNPATSRSRVVLPHPDGPDEATNEPGSTSRSIGPRACTPRRDRR